MQLEVKVIFIRNELVTSNVSYILLVSTVDTDSRGVVFSMGGCRNGVLLRSCPIWLSTSFIASKASVTCWSSELVSMVCDLVDAG